MLGMELYGIGQLLGIACGVRSTDYLAQRCQRQCVDNRVDTGMDIMHTHEDLAIIWLASAMARGCSLATIG